jgi:hypothetical protein
MCGPSHIQLAAAGTGLSRPVPQADELATRLVAVPEADAHRDHHGIEKNSPEPLGPGELLFFVSNQ